MIDMENLDWTEEAPAPQTAKQVRSSEAGNRLRREGAGARRVRIDNVSHFVLSFDQ